MEQIHQLPDIPADHAMRMERALLSLDGLSVGDGFGECCFFVRGSFEQFSKQRIAPSAPWTYTDDTTMALSIVRCMRQCGRIHQDALAAAFAWEYARDPSRGYGGMAHAILRAIGEGMPWQNAAGRAFDGQGSCGNGGAMRAAPIGAYFADDYSRVVIEAKASAEVTHAHPDGQTGAVAVALAAAWMVHEGARARQPGHALIEFVLSNIPQTETYHQLKLALEVPMCTPPRTAALRLGNGANAIASDTVPFCLWCAARHPDDFQEALWSAMSVQGDIDTNCAIVGGIVALSAGRDSIPPEWLRARESLRV